MKAPKLITRMEISAITGVSKRETTQYLLDNKIKAVGFHHGLKLYKKGQIELLSRAASRHRGRPSKRKILPHAVIDILECSQRLGISVNTLRLSLRNWPIPYYKRLNGRVYFEWDEVEKWMKAPSSVKHLRRVRLLQRKNAERRAAADKGEQ